MPLRHDPITAGFSLNEADRSGLQSAALPAGFNSGDRTTFTGDVVFRVPRVIYSDNKDRLLRKERVRINI